jgi:hypothetical protein
MPCNDPDHMEMPVPCGSCGTWIELNAGWASKKPHLQRSQGSVVVCDECHEAELESSNYD